MAGAVHRVTQQARHLRPAVQLGAADALNRTITYPSQLMVPTTPETGGGYPKRRWMHGTDINIMVGRMVPCRW